METYRTSDNHGTSRCANYPHSTVAAAAKADKEQQQRKRCKSESDAGARAMGARVSRSRSVADVNYEPLAHINLLVNREDEADDEYELLASSESEGIEMNELNRDGRSIDCSIITSEQQSSDDHCAAAVVIRKFSTLPRAKSRETLERRCSFRSKAVVSEEVSRQPAAAAVVEKLENNNTGDDTTMQTTENGDKANESLFQSTTLPKARSRVSDSLHSRRRHSLRHSSSIDRRKCLSEINSSSSIVIVGESTSGTGE
jgi:hypothetical protein